MITTLFNFGVAAVTLVAGAAAFVCLLIGALVRAFRERARS